MNDEQRYQYHLTANISEIKLRNFQFKYIHRILPTNTLLQKMNITQNSLCTFCNNSEETLEHLFLMCPVVEQLWEKVEKFISDKTQNHTILSRVGKSFGTCKENNLINHIILLTKKHIYYSKIRKMKPSFRDFLQYVSTTKDIEKRILFKNMNHEYYQEKWSCLDS